VANDYGVDVDDDALKGNFGVEGGQNENMSDRRPLQDSRGCPPTLWSCHHTIVH